jgi:hypothetical protein
MKRSNGILATMPITFTFEDAGTYLGEQTNITAATLQEASDQVPWLISRYIGAMDADGSYVF